MDSFESRVREIFHYIAEFGVKRMPIHQLGRMPTESEKQKFKALVHFGFRLGQKILLAEMLDIQKNANTVKNEIKEANKLRDKDRKQKLLSALSEHELRIQVLRHFADFIAWQIVGGHHFKARVFYSGSKSRPDLLNTNLDSVIQALEQFHLMKPSSFGLISDLTTFIDVGDILWADYESVKIVEVKSGQKQRKVDELVEKIIDLNYEITEKDLVDITPSMLKQAERTIEQRRKGSVLNSFLNTEKGKDPFTDEKRIVIESSVRQDRYFDEIKRLMDTAVNNGQAFGSIENIVNIAVFKPESIPIGLDFSRSSYLALDKTILIDYVKQIYIPIREPLFFKPIGKEHLFNLLFGKLKVILSVNLDELITFFNEGGLKATWLSKKDSFRYKEEKKVKNRPFIFNNQVIQVQSENFNITLGDSFLIRLLYDNLTPTALRQTYLDLKLQNA